MKLGLDINTADMFYLNDGISAKLMWEHLPNVKKETVAWSISALLSLIPPYLGKFEEGIDFGLSKSINGEWYSAHYLQWQEDGSLAPIKTVTGDTVVDAVYEMLCWLLENKKL